MGITVLDLDNIVITGNTIDNTWHNPINAYQGIAGTVSITNNNLSNWDSNWDVADDTTIGDGCECGRALRTGLVAGTTIAVTGNTLSPNDNTVRVDDKYVKIIGVHTDAVGDLITQFIGSNTWTDNPDFTVVILVNNEVTLLARVNASQLRITEANKAVDTIGDILTGYFGLDAERERLTEIVSIFWFDNYHYVDKLIFASIEAVESALSAVETEYAKIIATFQGLQGGYVTNVEVVESYIASATRLAATLLGPRTVAEEIVELVQMYGAGYIGVDNIIHEDIAEIINAIVVSEEIDTLCEYFGLINTVLG